MSCWLKEFCILIDIQLPNFCQNNSRSFAKCGNRQWFSKTNKQPLIALRSGWTSFVLLIVPCETIQVWHYRLKVFKNRYGRFAWPNYEMFREYKMFLSCSALAHSHHLKTPSLLFLFDPKHKISAFAICCKSSWKKLRVSIHFGWHYFIPKTERSVGRW